MKPWKEETREGAVEHKVTHRQIPVAFWYNPATGKVTVDVIDLMDYFTALRGEATTAEVEKLLDFLTAWLATEQTSALTRGQQILRENTDSGSTG